MQVDEEEDVGPDVMLMVDVVLEAVAVVLEVVATSRTDEARFIHIALSCPLDEGKEYNITVMAVGLTTTP